MVRQHTSVITVLQFFFDTTLYYAGITSDFSKGTLTHGGGFF